MLPVRPNKDSDDNDRSKDPDSEPSVASKQVVVDLALSGMALSLEMGLWLFVRVCVQSSV